MATNNVGNRAFSLLLVELEPRIACTISILTQKIEGSREVWMNGPRGMD